MPILISQEFANNGDTQVIPQSDINGFVSFLSGYTSDYEINLASGNPNAKAVERLSMNWLFQMITDNLMFIQDHGAQQYFSTKVGGYPKRAVVINNSGTSGSPDWRIFMSAVDGNTNPLPSNGENQYWQEIQLPSEARQYLLIPQGGDVANPYVSKGLQSIAIDFNTIRVSTSIVINSDSVAATCANLPSSIGKTAKAGLLEVIAWVVNPGAVVNVIQRYTNSDGYFFTRNIVGTTVPGWTQDMKVNDVQLGVANIGTSTGDATMVASLSAGYSWPPRSGSELTLVNDTTNTGAVSLQIGANTVAIKGMDNQPLPAGSIVAGQPFKIQYDGTAWRLVYAMAAPQIGQDAVAASQFVTKRQLDLVAATILTYNDIFEVGETRFLANGVDPNTKLGPLGQTWTRLPDNMMIRTTSAAHTALLTGGQDSVTMTAAMLIQHSHSINITSTPSGPWPDTTGNAGVHDHTGTTNDAGGHTHTINGVGDHQHTSTLSNNRNGTGIADGANPGNPDGFQTSNPAGAHTHSMNSAGVHSHSLSINNSGNHSHSYTLPAHTHTFNGNTGNTGAPAPSPIPTLPRYVTLNGWYRAS